MRVHDAFSAKPFLQMLENDEQYRYYEYTQQHARQHPADCTGTNAPVPERSSALGPH